MGKGEVRQMVCSLILATDMTFHHSLLKDFEDVDTKSPNKIYPQEEKEVKY